MSREVTRTHLGAVRALDTAHFGPLQRNGYGNIMLFHQGRIVSDKDVYKRQVIISAVIARLVFGSSGLIGKAAPGETREYFTGGKGMLCNVILGLGIGTTTGFVYQALVDGGASAASIGSYPVLCFGIAAVSLIFAQTGFAMPATHHIALISALAAVTAQNPVMGIVFGILTSLFGDFIGKTFNSCCDTHIDPPAFTIFIFTFIVNVLFGSGFFSV